MNAMKESKTLHRVTAAVLTVAFLGFVFAAFGAMIANNGRDILKSVQMTDDMKATLPAHPSRLDRLAARINGFTAGIADAMWL